MCVTVSVASFRKMWKNILTNNFFHAEPKHYFYVIRKLICKALQWCKSGAQLMSLPHKNSQWKIHTFKKLKAPKRIFKRKNPNF